MRIVLSLWLYSVRYFTGVCFVDPFTWFVISIAHIAAYIVIVRMIIIKLKQRR